MAEGLVVRRSKRWVVVIVLVLAAIAVGSAAWATPPSASATNPTSAVGGGFVNVVSVSPQVTGTTDPLDASVYPGRLLAGTDLGGFYRSDNNGLTWTASNGGLAPGDPRHLGVAAIAWNGFSTATTPGTGEVVALVGRSNIGFAGDDRLLRSTDGGVTWADFLPTSQPIPKGAAQLPPGQPRYSGDRIVWVTKDLLYVGGYDGLFRYQRDATTGTWCGTGLVCGQVDWDPFSTGSQPAGPVRAIVAADRDVFGNASALYLSVEFRGAGTPDTTADIVVQLRDLTNTNPTKVALTAPSGSDWNTVRDLALVKVSSTEERLYVAAGTKGVHVCPNATGSSNGTCVVLGGSGGPNLASDWSDVDGSAWLSSTSPAVLRTSCTSCVDSSTANLTDGAVLAYTLGAAPVWSTTVSLWQSSPPSGLLSQDVEWGLAGTRPFWLTSSYPQWNLGATHSVSGAEQAYRNAGQIVVNPHYRKMVYLPGQTEVWVQRDALSGSSPWRPGVKGMGSNVNRDVVGASKGTGEPYVAVADTDWRAITSPDGMLEINAQPSALANISGAVAAYDTDILVDGSTRQLVVGLGNKDGAVDETDGGAVWGCELEEAATPPANACRGTTWTDLSGGSAASGFPTGTGTRVLGVTMGKVTNGSTRWFVVAALDGKGLWATMCTEIGCTTAHTWRQVSTNISANDGATTGPKQVCSGVTSGELLATYASPSNLKVGLYWPAGRQRFYVFDPYCGVYKSPDTAADWIPNWAVGTISTSYTYLLAPKRSAGGALQPSPLWRNEESSGYLAGALDTPLTTSKVTLYVSTLNGLYKVDGADSLSTGMPWVVGDTHASFANMTPTGVTAAGPVATFYANYTSGGQSLQATVARVVLAQGMRVEQGGHAALWVSQSAGATTMEEVTSVDARFQSQQLVPGGAWVDTANSKNRVFVATKAQGLVMVPLTGFTAA